MPMRPSIASLLVLPLALAACARPHESSPIEAPPDGAAQPEPLVDTAAIVDLDKLTACVAAGKKAVRVDFEYDGKTLRVSSCSAVDRGPQGRKGRKGRKGKAKLT